MLPRTEQEKAKINKMEVSISVALMSVTNTIWLVAFDNKDPSLLRILCLEALMQNRTSLCYDAITMIMIIAYL